MDNYQMYAIIGIITLLLVIVATLKGEKKNNTKTKEQKRAEIINTYKSELNDTLKLLERDPLALKAKKLELIQGYSEELSRNIFFNSDEIKSIISQILK